MRAAAAPLVPDEYSRRLWRVQDGLPENTVQAIVQDATGFLWVGTIDGVTRFDGDEFYGFDPASFPGLPGNSIFCLLAGRDGSLWIGSDGGGLMRFYNGHIEHFGAARGLTNPSVRALLQDEHDRLWVGTDEGLFLLPAGGNRLQRLDARDDVPPLAVHAIAEDGKHRVWAGGSRLFAFSGEQQQLAKEYPLPGVDSQNRVNAILPAADGSLWVGTAGGLQRMYQAGFGKISQIAGAVRVLKQSSNGTVWIGTIGHGLWSYASNRFQKIDSETLLPSKSILSIFEDRSRRIWVGTQNGMVQLSKTPLHTFALPLSSDPDYETVSSDRDGSVWIVSSQVVRIRDGKAIVEHLPAIGNAPVRNLFRARDGALWVGTDGLGVYRLSGSSTQHFVAPQSLPSNFARAFLEDRQGAIWVATDEGVARIADGHVDQYGIHNGLAYFSAGSLIESSDGDIWIGTEQGVSDWHAGRFLTNATVEALRGQQIWSMAQDSAGFLWFGTRNNGLFRARGNAIVHFTKQQGLASNSIYAIAERTGRLWISTPNTVSSAPLAELDRADGTPSQTIHMRTYPMPYSAVGAQFYGGRQPSVSLDAQGRLWFPSSKGAVYVQPGGTGEKSAAPAVFLRSILVDGQPLESASGSVHIMADARTLTINYAQLLPNARSNVRFRYKLDGFDKAWTYAGSLHVATYTNLHAGSYRFRVQALDGDQDAEAAVTIVKQPFFWETWWFLTGMLLLLSSAIWGGYKVRIRQIHGRFHAVLQERGRVAREMHDTVIQGCTSTSALLEAIAIRRDGVAGPEKELLDYARAQIRATIDEARTAIWNLRHREGPERELSDTLATLAANTHREFNLPVNFHWEGDVVLLSSPIVHEVSMMVREALCNAAVHGSPSRIELQAKVRAEHVHLRISDNGAGFVLQPKPGHFGLQGMRERAENLGGRFHVSSKPGYGTKVELVLLRNALRRRSEQDWPQ